MSGPTGRTTAGRPAVHAGTFYPAAPAPLADLVDRQLAAAAVAAERRGGEAPASSRPLGLLVPHAGLVYSGPVAAAAWQTLRAAPPATIVLVGTNHYVPALDGLAVWPSGDWHSPLGDVEVATALAERIADLGPGFLAYPAAHRDEHSLEVQLPFLRRACPGSRIVPLLAGFPSRAGAERAGTTLGRLLAEVRGEGTDLVLVVSSDLVHYPAAAAAARADRDLLAAVAALDGAALAGLDEALRRQRIPGLVCALCGLDAVLCSLAALRAMGARTGIVLAAATSADVPFGDPDRTVGYGAVGFA